MRGSKIELLYPKAAKEINIRESLTWTNTKLSSGGWTDDVQIFNALDTNLGTIN